MKRTRSSAKRDGKPPKLDIRTVAALARVSIATVSRTINRVATVDPDLAARVWKAVEELNYFPNTQARALVSGRSKLLGLIVSEITNPFFPELIQEFEHLAVEHGYEIMIASTTYDRQRSEACVRRMLERKVDGVAVMTFGIEKLLLDPFAHSDLPLVSIDSAPDMPRSTIITVDYAKGIHQAIEHFATLGHREIGFISGPLLLGTAVTRRDAFLAAMAACSLKVEPQWVIEGDHTLDGGRDAMAGILALPARPTAILCSNDMTAIGVQHAVYEAGLKIPHDLSLIGLDDVHIAEYTMPPLTTIRLPCKDLAEAAVFSLLEHLGHPGRIRSPQLRIPTSLIVRETTAALKTP